MTITYAYADTEFPAGQFTGRSAGQSAGQSAGRSVAAAGIRASILAGFVVLAVAFGGFGTWAALAPLDSAAVAPGVVVVDGKRKTIQHLEGGIIDDILVRDGDFVETDEVLVRLSHVRPRATLDLLTGQYRTRLALKARLQAERDGHDRIRFPAQLLDHRDEPELAETLAAQEQVFDARRRAFDGQITILNQRIAQYHDEIAGLEAQIAAEDRMLDLLGQEIADVQHLFDRGNARKPRLLELQRRAAEIEGERGRNRALIARARQQIAEMEQQIIELRHQRLKEVTGELQTIQAEIADQLQRLRDAADVLDRLDIRAPRSGIVVGLNFHTSGGVIGPGEPILDIVPQEDRLLVEARVRPEDIDDIRLGLPAQVRLTAYSARRTPTLDGKVVRVSADRLDEPRTGASYFETLVAIDPASLDRLPEVSLSPGMPAEVLIVTGERTAFDYALSPVTDAINRAFREP
ncbi:MAG TPA: HlyD family type I secretion periplasmic adaptor subunit [Arenibaculum sp.]|nr:HlyD family type I secretion periplasmic adaptor subunit [Arenibaculum sp.]